jgi:chemotaxis signal transduction protein
MSLESQWVTFRIAGETFGFEIQFVRELLRMPQVHAIPQSSFDHLGVISLRNSLIPVFDLRRKFGIPPLNETASTLVALLQARLQDHENWLAELHLSVAEKREFSLTTDPHKCAFGKWYDAFHTDDLWLRQLLRKFDEPHLCIHHAGHAILEMQKAGKFDHAALHLQSSGVCLAALKKLFTEAMSLTLEHSQSSLIVIASETRPLGVAVDEIEAVMRCRDDEIQPPDSIPGSERFSGLIGLLPMKGSSQFVMLLDPAQLYPQLIASMQERQATDIEA